MPTDMFYGASPEIFRRAKMLRANLTPAEHHLWQFLRSNQLEGFRFKAQHPFYTFIADFYCHAAKLIIELDGAVHESTEQKEYDDNRTHVLNEFGVTVLRFTNDDIFNDIKGVLARISALLQTVPPTP
ncbi:endonuclease domain-containing protein [Fibrisoma limi]|uniref:endonuclease domain-containing protein n=1 Tax=Fibrisoma limi TaxID=663275 RepID=UPI000586FDFB|nr:endonuclease domain-containing protein [Fibrisoma limi]